MISNLEQRVGIDGDLLFTSSRLSIYVLQLCYFGTNAVPFSSATVTFGDRHTFGRLIDSCGKLMYLKKMGFH